jgi:hypothetical protein
MVKGYVKWTEREGWKKGESRRERRRAESRSKA